MRKKGLFVSRVEMKSPICLISHFPYPMRKEEVLTFGHMGTSESKDYLIDAFFALLEKREFYACDVGSICNKAGVSRATFYRYFKSKQDIILTYFQRVEDRFLTIQGPITPYSNIKEFVYRTFDELCKEKDRLLLLVQADQIHLLNDFLNQEIEKDFKENHRGSVSMAYLYAGAMANLEVYYLTHGCKESPQELTETVLSFLKIGD